VAKKLIVLPKVIAFDVWSPFAYFRKGFTTTTALTYPFMPRSAIEGLVGAIIGLESEEYSRKLNDSKIAVKILNRVQKFPFSTMHTHVDAWKDFGHYLETGTMHVSPEKFRARVKIELLEEPKFRIYFSQESNVYDSLKQKLLNHETIFTPYLGTSSMLASFEYIDEYDYTVSSGDEAVEVSTIIPFFTKKPPKVHLENGKKYAFEQNIPVHITADREVKGYYDAAYSPNGSSIKTSQIETQTIETKSGREHIVFIPTEIST
jgi:CRISPR-associated protein Cas5h